MKSEASHHQNQHPKNQEERLGSGLKIFIFYFYQNVVIFCIRVPFAPALWLDGAKYWFQNMIQLLKPHQSLFKKMHVTTVYL